MLLDGQVNSYGHVGTVASDFVGLVHDIGINDTLIPTIQYRPSKHLIYRDGPTQSLFFDRLMPS